MIWLKKMSGSQPSQETKVYYEKDDKKDEESKNFEELKIDNTQESDEATQSSQESWWSSWSGSSQRFDSKGKKREFSIDDEEEDQCWKSFCTQSTQKVKLSQPESSSSSKHKEDEPESSSSSQQKEDENKNADKEDDAKVSFYVKVGKHKKFKYN